MRVCFMLFVVAVMSATPLAAQDLGPTLAHIKETKTIKIGYRQAQPPMSFVDKDGQPVGYTIDICQEIVTAVKAKIGADVEVEYIPVSSENRFNDLISNKIDLLCGATTKTLGRSEKVAFSQLTFVTGASFMTRQGKSIRNNFGGKKIGVNKGSTTATALQTLFAEIETKAEIVMLDSMAAGIMALKLGELDAVAADQIVLIGLALASGNPGQYEILPDLFSYEPFALAMRRNDDDFRLVADREISRLFRSKDILTIYDKWLGQFTRAMPSALQALVELNAIAE